MIFIFECAFQQLKTLVDGCLVDSEAARCSRRLAHVPDLHDFHVRGAYGWLRIVACYRSGSQRRRLAQLALRVIGQHWGLLHAYEFVVGHGGARHELGTRA